MVDASIVHTHMMLAAASLGLGTTWVCAIDAEKTRKVFNVPDNYEIEGFLPTGYPKAEPSGNHAKRIGVDEFTKYNSF